MAKVGSNQKVFRTLQLLRGLRTQQAQRALAPYGLSDKAVEEGIELLARTLMPRPYSADAEPAEPNRGLLGQLEEFENHWFPIAQAILSRRYEEVNAWLFNNLERTSGRELIISVTAFVRRMRTLQAGRSPFGPQGVEAVEFLAGRGLSDDVMQLAEAMVGRFTEFEEPVEEFDPEAEQAAVDALWAWYLEWSRIARTAITSRSLLRQLGFGQRGRPRKGHGKTAGGVLAEKTPPGSASNGNGSGPVAAE